MAKFTTVDEYIATLSPDKQKGFKQFRALIKKLVPGVTERISYQMPAYEFHGILVWFAAWKTHYGLYPHTEVLKAFSDKLKKYNSSKGAVQFPDDEPLPLKLISEIVNYRVKSNLSKIKMPIKKTAKKAVKKLQKKTSKKKK